MDKRTSRQRDGKTFWALLFGMAAGLTATVFFFITAHAAPELHTRQSPSSQILSYKDLPPGAAPAIAAALLKELPDQYHLKEINQGFAMSNPFHGIDVIFTHEGPRFLSGEKMLGMTLSSFGYAGSVKPVNNAKLINDNGRLLYERDDVSEWYINSRWGVEQGFTIHQAPVQKKEGNFLIVELELSGNFSCRLDTNTLLLSDAAGNNIAQYTGLQVYDADNAVLPALLKLADNRLQIHVDDQAARYPITIDPWFQAAKLTAGDGAANDWFGFSVAISENTLVVGAVRDDIGNATDAGSAYVFEKPMSGWADITGGAKLTASDGSGSDYFAWSVAIDGDTVVVGAPYDDAPAVDSGSAYVFVRPAAGWTDMTQTAKLTAAEGSANDRFGNFVAISGDTVAVGAHLDDNSGGSDAGSAYVFVRPDTGWADMTHTAQLTAGDGIENDNFGISVAINGDTVIVGADLVNDDTVDPPVLDAGAAYVFVKPGTGWENMVQTAKLTISDTTNDDRRFGYSVAVSSDTVVVGAYFDNNSGGENAGSAYIFVKPDAGWIDMTETAILTASDGAINDRFGYSVAIGGDTVVAGAYYNDEKGSDAGSAYVFVKPDSGWADMTETAILTAGDGATEDWFGYSVAISGDTVVAGAYHDDDLGLESGSVYVFPAGGSFPWALFLPTIMNTDQTK